MRHEQLASYLFGPSIVVIAMTPPDVFVFTRT